MFSISNNTTYELVIKNSRFICQLYRINSIDDINVYLDLAKKKYPKATHYCYSYIFDDRKKAYDDNEPGGTAGMPILNVLEKANLYNTLCIVIRYFGGIKLGSGGLVRAYSKVTRDTLKLTTLNEIYDGFLISIPCSYEKSNDLLYLLRNQEIVKKEYLEDVTYFVNVDKSILNTLDINDYKYNIIKKTYIEKSKSD